MIGENQTSFVIPNNIRQIGQIRDEYRIYVEDYVTTYLNQVSACVTEKSKAVLLLGYMYEADDKRYYFVRGAICGEKEYEVMREDFFDEEAKKYFTRIQNEYFPQMEVIGWAIVKGELGRLTEEYIGRHILQDKSWDRHLFMEIDKYNCIDRFYICGEELRRAASGYFVFYDRNEEMQKLLINFNEQKGNEAGIKEYDRTVRYFRDIQGKNKEEGEKGKQGGFYALAMVAVIAVLVIAISSVNNYDKLLGFESTLDKVADFVDEQIAAVGKEIHADKSDKTNEDKIYTQKVEEVGSDDISAVINSAPDSDSKEPEQDGEKPGADSKEPEQDGGKPGADSKEPEQDGEKPGVDSKQPEQDGEKPGADSKEPEQDGEKPGADSKEPEQDSKEPGKENSGTPDEEKAENSKETNAGGYIVYIIQKGDTLMDISRRYYGNADMVDEICSLNGIENSDAIFYEQRILLPQ